MRNITVTIDDDTHRLARIRAAELDTSVSALVRGYLRRLASGDGGVLHDDEDPPETAQQRRSRHLDDVLSVIAASDGGFRTADNLSREELYERSASR